MELISPITLVASVKDDGGDAISAAKTVDGGVAFVRWDPTGKSWYIDKELTAGEVLTSSPLSTSDLIDLGIPSPTISSANAEA